MKNSYPNNNPTITNEHDVVAELLPWYVNNTLTADERELVAKHLRLCADCRQTVNELQALSDYAPLVAEHYDWQPSAQHFDHLLRDIAELEADQPISAPVRKRVFRWRDWLGATPKPVVWLLSVESLALAAVLLLTVSANFKILTQPQFATLSTPQPLVGGAQAQIVFVETISEREIRDLLTSVHAQIVSGPSQLGVYQLMFQLQPPTALTTVLTTLRTNGKVKFLELLPK